VCAFIAELSSWNFDGRNGTRMTPMEIWIPSRCMKSRKSDLLGHVTWRGEEEDQRCLSYRGLDRRVSR